MRSIFTGPSLSATQRLTLRPLPVSEVKDAWSEQDGVLTTVKWNAPRLRQVVA